MKISLHYKGFIKIEKYENDSLIEIPENCTVRDLILFLGISKQQDSPYILVNNDPAWNSTVLKENDSVKLITVVAGG
ncbi:MAG: MoaD/ThiS family protein [Dehalococcoidia bacterium]|jgi:sulfur carrier protein ThiS